MDSRVEAVLARYEGRAAREAVLMEKLALEEAMRRVDEFLIPIGPEAGALLNALISMKSIQLAAQSDPDQYEGPRVGGPHDPPERGWRTADRPIFFAFGGSVGAEGRPGWSSFVEEIGMGHLLGDARLDRNGRNSTGHGSLVHEMREIYEKQFANYMAEDLVTRIRARGASASIYMRADETLAHAQTQALDLIREAPAGDTTVRVRAFPARFSAAEFKLRGHAPALGQHGLLIAQEAGLSPAEIAQLRNRGGLTIPDNKAEAKAEPARRAR